MRWTFLAAVLIGCKVVDAPANLEDLVVFGFETFGDEPSMQATLDNLVPLLDEHADELGQGFRVGELTNEQIAGAGVVDAPETDGIAGAMGLVPYRNSIDEVVPLIIADDKEDYFENMLQFDPVDRSDRACFLAHECPTFEQFVEERVTVVLLGESTRRYTHVFHWIEHDEHGTVVEIRSLSPDPIEFNTTIAQVHQQYGLAWIIPDADGEGARRVEAFWIDGEVIGLDVPDSFAVDSAVNGMRRTAETIDNVIDGVD